MGPPQRRSVHCKLTSHPSKPYRDQDAHSECSLAASGSLPAFKASSPQKGASGIFGKLLVLLDPIGRRNGQTCSSRTGRISGLPSRMSRRLCFLRNDWFFYGTMHNSRCGLRRRDHEYPSAIPNEELEFREVGQHELSDRRPTAPTLEHHGVSHSTERDS